MLLFLLSMEKEIEYTGSDLGSVVKQSMAEGFCNLLYDSFLPAFSFVQEKRSESNWFADSQITQIMPLYGYSRDQRKKSQKENERLSLDDILLAEAQEGTSEENDIGQFEITGSTENVLQTEEAGMDETLAITEYENGATLEELLMAENEAAALAGQEVQQVSAKFQPHSLQAQMDTEALRNYETLVEQIYSIDANTMAGSELLDVTKLSNYDMTVSKETAGPQILIYHTHSQEAFVDSVPGDQAGTIVGVGGRLAAVLTETYGYQVLHHTGQYDVEVRDDAYSKSLPAIEQVLADNPSIQVVIDLHRDEMPADKKLVMDLDGRPTARFMFFNGLSRTRKTGDISYLYNENLNENLAFSFQMQKKSMEYYPGLTRKIYLKGYRYNMHLKPKTLLVELGAQNNTLEEVMNACDPLAHILDLVLNGQ